MDQKKPNEFFFINLSFTDYRRQNLITYDKQLNTVKHSYGKDTYNKFIVIQKLFLFLILIGRLWKIGGKIDRNKQIFSRKPEQSIVIKGEV